MILANAFSLNMLTNLDSKVECQEVTRPYVANQLKGCGLESAVGHADTAAVFGDELGIHVPCERRAIQLAHEDTIFVGQYVGPRLPEGATSLPSGATIKWVMVTIKAWGK